jgi:hypothetical protein
MVMFVVRFGELPPRAVYNHKRYHYAIQMFPRTVTTDETSLSPSLTELDLIVTQTASRFALGAKNKSQLTPTIQETITLIVYPQEIKVQRALSPYIESHSRFSASA